MENVLILPYNILLKTALGAEFTETQKKNYFHLRIWYTLGFHEIH